MKRKRVRIAVLMAPDGDWDCRGWGPDESDHTLKGDLLEGALRDEVPGAWFGWIEADVPVPEPTTTIAGTVVEDQEATDG